MRQKFETDPSDIARVSGQDNTFNSNSALRWVIEGAGYDPDINKPVQLSGQSSPGSDLDPPQPAQSTSGKSILEHSKVLYPDGEFSKTNDVDR